MSRAEAASHQPDGTIFLLLTPFLSKGALTMQRNMRSHQNILPPERSHLCSESYATPWERRIKLALNSSQWPMTDPCLHLLWVM